jgi:5-methyltetrahydrofolate--homocysteine methyltransferase
MGLDELRRAVIEGNQKAARDLATLELDAGTAPESILQEGLIAAMSEVGRLFECGKLYVPEMLIAARAMQGVLELLRPLLLATGVPAAGKVVIGAVKGDLHDIGKNLVATMLEGAGFEVVDLGTDVSPDKFVAAVDEKTNLVAMSALLTTTMPAMKATLDALIRAGVRSRVKVIVGGAPLTQEYADKIGADGYAAAASSAARLARTLLSLS